MPMALSLPMKCGARTASPTTYPMPVPNANPVRPMSRYSMNTNDSTRSVAFMAMNDAMASLGELSVLT